MFKKCADFFWKIMFFGWVIFPASSYLLPDVQAWKNSFYITILLPFLILLPSIWRSLIKPSNPVLIASILMAVYLWLSTFWSTTSPEYVGFFFKQLIYVYVYLSAGILLIERYPQTIEYLIKLILVCGFVSLLIAIFLYLKLTSGHGMTEEGWLYRFESFGMIKNPIVAAQHYGLLSLLAVYYFTINKQALVRVVCVVIAIVAILAVYWTRSRGPSFYLPLSFLILVVLSETNFRRKILTFIACLVSSLTLLLIVFPAFRHALFNRDFSIARRMEIWTTLTDEASSSIIFGVGARKIMHVESYGVLYHHAHSSLVEVFYYGGVLALILLLVCVCTALWNALQLKEKALLIPWFSYGIMCLATNGHYLLSRPGWQWLMFWIPIALIVMCHHKASLNDSRE